MNNGVYALPGFMTPAAKNWKSQLLTNEDGSVKLCVYVGKPGTKVYYSLGIPGWKWGFIKDAQYFIDKGYPQEVIDEVSKFADYLEEEVAELSKGAVVPDIVINGWPVPITESPIEDKVYWILNIPKFVLPAGDTEVQISANGKLIKYTLTRPYFSIHYNIPECTTSADTPEDGGDSEGDYLTFNADGTVAEGRLDNLVNAEYFKQGTRDTEWHIDMPLVTTATKAFEGSLIKTWTASLQSLQYGGYMLSGAPLEKWTVPLPSLVHASMMFNGCVLDKESALLILTSLPKPTVAPPHYINIGVHVDFKNDEELLAETENAKGRGWSVALQWNGTASAASASTYNLRNRRDPIYAKLGEPLEGKPYLDWGHYVTDWEENGYMEFASIEEAKEHFNIIEDINLINAE